MVAVLHGEVTDDDMVEADVALRSHPDFRPDFDQLVVGVNVEKFTVTREGIRKLTANDPLFSGASRRAIVAPTQVGFGMARMFELSRGGQAGEVQVFRSEDEALEWLGLIAKDR